MTIDKERLQDALHAATHGCVVQHDGWTCGTCFFAISDDLDNEDWQNVLLIRGDYNENELDNLPADREASYQKILRCCNGK